MPALNALRLFDSTTGWMVDASCRSSNPNVFFPERGESPAPAKDVCSRCPVAADCLDYALHNEISFGIWGGVSVKERRKMRRDTARALRPLPALPHGTQPSYRRGCRCDGCREANSQYTRLLREKAG